jgi:hypothetical protein
MVNDKTKAEVVAEAPAAGSGAPDRGIRPALATVGEESLKVPGHWPKQADGLAHLLERYKAALKRQGFVIEKRRGSDKKRTRLVSISWPPPPAAPGEDEGPGPSEVSEAPAAPPNGENHRADGRTPGPDGRRPASVRRESPVNAGDRTDRTPRTLPPRSLFEGEGRKQGVP